MSKILIYKVFNPVWPTHKSRSLSVDNLGHSRNNIPFRLWWCVCWLWLRNQNPFLRVWSVPLWSCCRGWAIAKYGSFSATDCWYFWWDFSHPDLFCCGMHYGNNHYKTFYHCGRWFFLHILDIDYSYRKYLTARYKNVFKYLQTDTNESNYLTTE